MLWQRWQNGWDIPKTINTSTNAPNRIASTNSIRVANALIRANKRFEYVIMPGQRHGFGDMNEWFFWKMADHYARWLMGDRTPRPIDIEEMNND